MRSSRLLWGLLIVLALAVSACGDDTAPSTNPETPTTETPTTPEEPIKVVLVSNQAAGDRGPVDGMISGLETSGATNGHETQFVEASDPARLRDTATQPRR